MFLKKTFVSFYVFLMCTIGASALSVTSFGFNPSTITIGDSTKVFLNLDAALPAGYDIRVSTSSTGSGAVKLGQGQQYWYTYTTPSATGSSTLYFHLFNNDTFSGYLNKSATLTVNPSNQTPTISNLTGSIQSNGDLRVTFTQYDPEGSTMGGDVYLSYANNTSSYQFASKKSTSVASSGSTRTVTYTASELTNLGITNGKTFKIRAHVFDDQQAEGIGYSSTYTYNYSANQTPTISNLTGSIQSNGDLRVTFTQYDPEGSTMGGDVYLSYANNTSSYQFASKKSTSVASSGSTRTVTYTASELTNLGITNGKTFKIRAHVFDDQQAEGIGYSSTYTYNYSVNIPTVTVPVITDASLTNEYRLAVMLSSPLPAGYYVAINFDDSQGGWLLQSDAGGHIKLTNLSGNTHWENRILNKPGLRSLRAGIFDANDNLVGQYSDGTTCTLDSCIKSVVHYDTFGDPQQSGSGSQLMRGVDVANGNFFYSTTDMSVPSKGLDFTVMRTYNSNLNAWTFNFDTALTFVPNTYERQIAIGPREDGRIQSYYKDMDNQWYALSPGNFDKLIEEDDGSFTLYTKGNLYYRLARPTSVNGRLLSINDRDGNALTFTHTANKITAVRDASNHNYSITRNSNGKITKVTDFTGRYVQYTWDSNNMITAVRDPKGNITRYTFNGKKLTSIKDAKGNTQYTIIYNTSGTYNNYVASVRDASGSVWEYLYTATTTGIKRPSVNGVNNNIAFTLDVDRTRVLERIDAQNYGDYKTTMQFRTTTERHKIAEMSLIEQIQYPNTGKTRISYVNDGQGNPSAITDALNRTTTPTWTTLSAQTNLTPLASLKVPGVSQTLRYSNFTPSGKAKEITDPLQHTVINTYDASGQLTQTKDARNYTTGITYNTMGRPTQITDALGGKTIIAYDTLGRVSTIRNNRGYTTSYTHDANGNVLTATDAKGNVSHYTYDANDNLLSTQDFNGNITTMRYDTFNRLIEKAYTVGGVQYKQKFAYDAMGRLASLTNENNHISQMQYDERGQLKKEFNPLSEVISYTYDTNGNVKTVTDAEGRRISYEYDLLNRLTKSTDALGLYEQYTYNTQGLLSTKRDKKGRITSYTYDALGQLTKVTDPDGGTTRASYDANGNLLTTTDRAGHTTSYAYDALNRMTQQTDAMGRKWKFTYDANGNMTSRTTPANKVSTYQYDERDQVTQIGYPDQTVRFTYDANGNRLTMQDDQGTTTYSYDERNRLTSVRNSFGMRVQYTYTSVGTLKELVYPDGKKVTYSYDNAERLSTLNDWLGDTTRYTRDRSGLVTKVQYGNGTTVDKRYDASARLISLSNKKGTSIISSHMLTLDNVGNPLSIQADLPLLPANLGRKAEMLYDASNRITTVGGQTITHDADGRMTADQTQLDPIAYAYNAQDLITTVSKNATVTDSYTYDGDGRRITTVHNGQITRYVLDPTGGDLYNVLTETDGSNAITHYYIYGEGLVSQVSGNTHHYYHFDQSGNTLALTDDSGNITDKYAYEPFGSTTTSGTTHNPFRFVGQYGVMDDGNGLHHMRARYYRTDVRRFVSLDALYGQVTDPMTLNRYQYVSGNPMVGVDPSGHKEEPSGSCNNLAKKYNIGTDIGGFECQYSLLPNGELKISTEFKNLTDINIINPSGNFLKDVAKLAGTNYQEIGANISISGLAVQPNDYGNIGAGLKGEAKALIGGHISENKGEIGYEGGVFAGGTLDAEMHLEGFGINIEPTVGLAGGGGISGKINTINDGRYVGINLGGKAALLVGVDGGYRIRIDKTKGIGKKAFNVGYKASRNKCFDNFNFGTLVSLYSCISK